MSAYHLCNLRFRKLGRSRTICVAWRYRHNLWANAIKRSDDPIRGFDRNFIVFVFPPGSCLVNNGKAENCILMIEVGDLKFGHVFKAEVNLRVILQEGDEKDMHISLRDRDGIQHRMQRLSALKLRPMETLSSQQQQKHQKMRLPMTAVVESDLNPIDCDVPLLRSNSFVPSESRLSPATNLSNRQPMFARCRTPNLPANSRSRSRLADRKRPIHVFSCSRLIR